MSEVDDEITAIARELQHVQTLYRYESKRYSVCIDPDAERYRVSAPQLELYEYKVHSETPCGYWFGFYGGKDQWCSKTSRKRYAHPSKDEAMQAYIERKRAFVRHSKAKLNRALEDLRLAENG